MPISVEMGRKVGWQTKRSILNSFLSLFSRLGIVLADLVQMPANTQKEKIVWPGKRNDGKIK